MSYYRRYYVPGGKYFFTVVTHKRKKILCSQSAIDLLSESFAYAKSKHPFDVEIINILPDHFHCIMQLPSGDSNFPERIRKIKYYFSIHCGSETNTRREKAIWQRRFWEHCIDEREDYYNCFNYIYYNAVKHGYVEHAVDWEHCWVQKKFSDVLVPGEEGKVFIPKGFE